MSNVEVLLTMQGEDNDPEEDLTTRVRVKVKTKALRDEKGRASVRFCKARDALGSSACSLWRRPQSRLAFSLIGAGQLESWMPRHTSRKSSAKFYRYGQGRH